MEVPSLDQPVVRLVLATALGLFLGLEREWSEKAAGVRTLALVSLLGAVFVVLDSVPLLAVGGVLVVVLGGVLSVRGLVRGRRWAGAHDQRHDASGVRRRRAHRVGLRP